MALFIAAAEDTKLEYDQFCRAERAANKAAMRLARTKPTTTSGAAAMIGHVRRETKGASEIENWVPLALKTAVAALTRTEAA